jgi:predicted RNase H-like nuclease (RuvC/YqgF family)
MEIKSVRYGRNFYIGDDYGSKLMEYFNIEAFISEGENEKQVLGQLFFKILKVHEIFEEYRKTLVKISNTESELNRKVERLDELRKEVARLETIYHRYKSGELSLEEFQQVCSLADLKYKQRRIIELEEEEIPKLTEQLKRLKQRKKLLEEKIKSGDF